MFVDISIGTFLMTGEISRHIGKNGQVCRLVHGDLSEYNILHYRDALYVIDVSQSSGHLSANVQGN